MDNLIYIANIILAVLGFIVALNISLKKREQKPMVCPLNMKCEQVLYSKYAKFLGIPLEILGIIYYSTLAVSYSILLFYPYLKNPLFVFSLFLITASGFAFSAYLLSIQAFKLKEWCSWCLMSAFISISIFIISSQSTIVSLTLKNLASEYLNLIVITYSLATSGGLGLIVTLEAIFLRFLSDLRISLEESSVLNIIRQMTWLALGVMVVSNYAMYLIDPFTISEYPNFLFKIIILGILVSTSFIYDIFISSKLVEIYSDGTSKQHVADKYLRTLPFFFAPITLVSWFMIFLLEMVPDLNMSMPQLTFSYISAIILSLIVGAYISTRTLRRA